MFRDRTHLTPFVLIALAAALVTGCGGDEASDKDAPCELVHPDPDAKFFEKLSDYCFFTGDMALQQPSDGVVPYDVNTVLYSDHSSKLRFIVLPEGEKIGFHETDRWDFPVGTTLVKTFYFPRDPSDPSKGKHLVETRLMLRDEVEWQTHTYRWNEEQTEATSFLVGRTIDVEWVDESGDAVQGKYRIPSKSDCRNCHVSDNKIVELGPRTRQLNRLNDFGDGPVNQLQHYQALGMFSAEIPDPAELPALIDPKDESHPLDARARTYLEGNCAHCHSPGGAARNSGLFLNIEEDNPTKLGVCKPPVAAGRGAGEFFYDIVPGKPEESIMIFRINSNEPGIKMPELPLTTIDHFGVELLSQWISEMEGECAPRN